MKPDLKFILYLMFVGALVLACGKKQSEEELLQQAIKFESEENWDEAIHAYKKLVRDYPGSSKADTALQKTAFIYYNNIHDFHKAIDVHSTLVGKYPNSKFVAQASFMIGFIYANDLKDYDKAKEAYNNFLEKHPDNDLVESVKWELKHLGKDVNEQVINLFENDSANGDSKSN